MPDDPLPRGEASPLSPMTDYTPPEEEGAGSVLGPYRLLRLLGKGGMGAVWLAEQRAPVERQVALKIIKTELSGPQVIARFEAERQALAMMDHPNIARVLDAWSTAAGRPFFVMEFVRGVPFLQYCDNEKLSLKERIELFIPVCRAVQHAHQKGIVHRDLKPSNVLVALYDGKAIPKVIDFGVAKATQRKLTDKTIVTDIGHIVGTLEYMAPEQAELNNLDVDTRADIYSLGVMLYELLTGSLPFSRKELHGGAFDEMLRMIREVEPPKPSTRLTSSDRLRAVAAQRGLEPNSLASTVRGDLDWIVMKCLEKERARRYDTANQLGEELERYLKDEPVQAGPPSFAYRSRKFLRRNRGPVIAAGLVLTALVLGIVGTSYGLYAANVARIEEQKQRESAEANEKKAKESAERERLAADKEREATLLATRRLEQVNTANGLLESVFVDIDPFREEKGGPSLREQLARRLVEVARKLDNAALGDRFAVARLQFFLGNTLRGLGEPAAAIPLLERAASAEAIGPDEPDTLGSMNALANAYHAAGQLAKALPLYEETLAKRQAKLGVDHPDTLVTVNNLALAYHAVGQFAKAMSLHEAALEKLTEKFGPDHATTLTSMNNLALAYNAAGQLPKALPLFEETLEKRKATLGPDHPDTLLSMNNLGQAYLSAGRIGKALPLLEETLEKKKARLGPDHPNTLTSMNNLALTYQAAGQSAKALPLFEETLSKRKTKLGRDHPDTLLSTNNLAMAYQAGGQLGRALPLFEEALLRRKTKLGPEHPGTLESMDNLAVAYVAVNEPTKAIPLFVSWLDVMRKRPATDRPRFAREIAKRALPLMRSGQYAAAEPMLRECLDIRAETAPDAWTTFDARAMLGASLLGQKQYKDAQPLLEDGFEGMRVREKTMSAAAKSRLTDALAALVRHCRETDRKEDAAKWTSLLVERDGRPLEEVHDVGKELTLNGQLDDKTAAVIFQVRLTAGTQYVIDMTSPDARALDPYLYLRDSERATLAEDDDGGGNRNARILFRPPTGGIFQLRATSFNAGHGPFTIAIKQFDP